MITGLLQIGTPLLNHYQTNETIVSMDISERFSL